MSESLTSILELLKYTASEVRGMTDPNQVMGQPITTGDVTVIPISKASFGFAGGGADGRDVKGKISGGAGAKAELTPISFLVIQNGTVRVVPATATAEETGGLLKNASSLVAPIGQLFQKKKKAADSPDGNGTADTSARR